MDIQAEKPGLNSENPDEWDLLSDFTKGTILKGIEQANAGLGKPVKEVIANVRAKYGLDK